MVNVNMEINANSLMYLKKIKALTPRLQVLKLSLKLDPGLRSDLQVSANNIKEALAHISSEGIANREASAA